MLPRSGLPPVGSSGLVERSHFPQAEVYDPLAQHADSLGYDVQRRDDSVFFHHNRMCREVDVLLAFVPEASMGTAIEGCGRAYQHGAVVITISPLKLELGGKVSRHGAIYDGPFPVRGNCAKRRDRTPNSKKFGIEGNE